MQALRTNMRTQALRTNMHTQARACVRRNLREITQSQAYVLKLEPRKVFIAVLQPPWIKITPKHVPTPFLAKGFHLNPSHNKTQEFSRLKANQNTRLKENSKNEKVEKTYRFSLCNARKMLSRPVKECRRLLETFGTHPTTQVNVVTRNGIGGFWCHSFLFERKREKGKDVWI